MKKTFTLLAMAAFAANVSSQVITQNSVPNTVVALQSVACAGPAGSGYTSDNAYSRAFVLADYAITYNYKITKVAFGVENANKTFNVNLNLYNLTGAGNYPAGTTTLLQSVPVSVGTANALGMVDTGTVLNQVIPAGGRFVVEVAHTSDAVGLQQFYMGANNAAETKPSYIKSTGCGIPTPTATTAIGFPNAKWVMTVTGENALGVTEIINSKDLQVYPNPVKDVLNFKLANNLKVESIELYNVTGQKVNTVNAKAAEGVNVSNFPKGTYILKVKADNGVVYVQKVLKN